MHAWLEEKAFIALNFRGLNHPVSPKPMPIGLKMLFVRILGWILANPF
jgi:hypothetical protein